MAARRDNTFPSVSIGRVQGAHIQRTASPDVLSAHPLLSPTSSTTNLVPNSPPSPDASHPSAPRYVPYTPRQRVPTTPATTGMTVHPSVAAPQQQRHGDATSKLQLMNLKAAAQNVGLDTGSVGWSILEKLVGESDYSAEWNEIWSAITVGKATLLLPLEQASSHENIALDFIKDHIVLLDGSSRNHAPIITLSGLRGILVDETLVLRSSLHPSSKLFQSLLTPTTRSSSLLSLPPLPFSISSSIPSPFPTFSVPSYTSSLPLPPRSSGLTHKPPLPPRPNIRIPSSSSPAGTSRLSNPFSSLFGGKPSSSQTPSPTPSVISLPPPEADHVVEICAFTIDRRISRKDIGKDIIKSLKSEIKESLSGLPSWVVDRVQNFSTSFCPLIKAPKKSAQEKESIGTGSGSVSPYIINHQVTESPEELSEQFQDFYAVLEQDLRLGGSPLLGRRREEAAGEEKDERERERREKEREENDARIREVLEAVERTICSLFYDRLFMQPSSDDASHDEALTSRIAALNMLDLSLEHLDVNVGQAGPEVDVIVKACGETLTHLDTACRSPAEKSAVLVAAHKIVVDGLSKLPPIRLKSDSDAKDEKSKPDEKPLPPITVEISAKSEHPPTDETSSIDVSLLNIPNGEGSSTTDTGCDTTNVPPERSASPLLTTSPLAQTTPVSGDVLLPLLIFSVVKANPPHLVSHLLFTQRFRNQNFGGEESYCLINLMAVAEFLENVDLGALGLGDSEKKVISTADLTPIPINRVGSESPLLPQDAIPPSLRGRVEQQVDAITGSANKVISGVVDTSFGVLRSLLPGNPSEQGISADAQDSAPWNNARPGFGLLRRESGFSIASLAASLPGRDRTKSVSSHHQAEEGGQQLVAVSSRPGSVKSVYANSDSESGDSQDEDGEEDGEDDDEEEEEGDDGGHDSRSIRSFENMMSRSRQKKERKSLSDRLAHMSGLSRLAHGNNVHDVHTHKDSPPPSRRTSLLPPGATTNRFDTPISSRAASPSPMRLAPPNQRFLECSADDLKVSEIGELLREYRRIVEGARALGAFED